MQRLNRTKELLVIGTSGLAKEMAQLARNIDPSAERWERISFVTHDGQMLGKSMPYGGIHYMDSDLGNFSAPTDVVLGVGYPDLRHEIIKRLAIHPNLQFPNLIHPGVEIDPEMVRMGRGNAITKGVVMTCDITIGDFNLFNWVTTVGHDAIIGNYNVINPGCSVSGRVTLGDECLIGTGARILENLEIASRVVVGAGAVVTKSISEPGVYVGVPAQKIQKK